VTWDRIAFAARRRKAQSDLIAALEPVVEHALERKSQSANWWRAVVDAAKPLFDSIVTDDGGNADQAVADWARLSLDLTKTLTKTKKIEDYTAELIATWVAGEILSVATIAAAKQDGEPFELEWVSMHDTKVRHTHRVADGQRIKPGDKFHIGDSEMRYPLDTSAPIKEWINCRCTVAAVPVDTAAAVVHDNALLASHTGPRLTQGATQMTDTLIPWHGVLAPEGKWSGDRRKFGVGSLSHRDLSLPLTWQKVQEEAHNGSVTVASIDWIDMNRDGDNLMHAGGMILQSDEADEWVGLLAHFGRLGVSVDADNAEAGLVNEDDSPFSFDESDGEPYGMMFSAARVCSASSVNIPAFAEAFVTMGQDPEHDYGDGPTDEQQMAAVLAMLADSTIEEISATLGEVQAGRGPGWLTNPADTKRIHDYWTVPGEPGYEKIAWGTPGDFNRCRVEVGQEIGENSPEKLRFINQICSQWHKDATGFWPGHAPTEQAAAKPEGEQAPAISLVASSTSLAPSKWFGDPQFTGKTPIKITDDGEMYGHLAYWDTCHMNFANTCIMAPHSQNGYGFFLTGEVMTDAGPVATGPITIATGHAENRLGMRPALSHYDNTGTAVADVTVGEDAFGIWMHGWVRPWASEQQVYELRAAALSGDWRRVPGTRPPQMELIAALGVNSPGFPAARVGIADGVQVSLVASAPAPVVEEEDSLSEVAEAIAAAIESRENRRTEFQALAETFGEV